MISQDVIIPVDGSQMSAHLARPQEGSGAHPAIIVLPDVFGFTPEVRRIADLCASTGYVGMAIDFYHRTNPRLSEPYTEEGNQNAWAAASHVTAQSLTQDVLAAIAWLTQQSFVRAGKIATWGFGFGANAAFITSSLHQLCGGICFYPTHVATPMPSGGEAPIEHAAEVAIPLLLLFGEKDYYISRYDMDRIYSALSAAGKKFHMQIYPDVGHSFFRHGRPEAVVETQRYSDEAIAQAVADSWDLVRKFLRDVFSRPQSHAAESGDIRTERKRQVQSQTTR
jgi:carboxymethylenebutenolidase